MLKEWEEVRLGWMGTYSRDHLGLEGETLEEGSGVRAIREEVWGMAAKGQDGKNV